MRPGRTLLLVQAQTRLDSSNPRRDLVVMLADDQADLVQRALAQAAGSSVRRVVDDDGEPAEDEGTAA